MELKGQLKSISCDYFSGHTLITCETEEAAAPQLEKLQGVPLAITFKKFRKKRGGYLGGIRVRGNGSVLADEYQKHGEAQREV